jgi:perosamine synthetase
MLRSGAVTEELEKRFTETTGVRHACAVCNGTAALHLAYLSTVKKRGRVLVPDFTFISTASAAVHAGCRPVLVDVDPDTLTLSVEAVKEKAAEAAAVAPVHLYGNPCDMEALAEVCNDHTLKLISDSAQSLGSRVGGRDPSAFSDASCFSLYATKTVTSGEGGVVVTDDPSIHRRLLLLRSHGEESRYRHVALGYNYRLTDVASALALGQLDRLRALVASRRRNAEALRSRLGGLEALRFQKVIPGAEHSYCLFTVQLDLERLKCSRDEFAAALRAENVDCAVHYPLPLHLQPALRRLASAVCPNAVDASRRVLSLPVHPGLSPRDLEAVCSAVEKVAAHYGR